MDKRKVACAWVNRAGIGEPMNLVATDWRAETDEERRARRGARNGAAKTPTVGPRGGRGIQPSLL